MIPSHYNQFHRNKFILRNKFKDKKILCHYCNCVLIHEKTPYNDKNPNLLTFDHKIPKNKGGTNNVNNLIFCCNRCNNLKANIFSYDEFKSLITNIEQRDKMFSDYISNKNKLREKNSAARKETLIFNLAILFFCLTKIQKRAIKI